LGKKHLPPRPARGRGKYGSAHLKYGFALRCLHTAWGQIRQSPVALPKKLASGSVVAEVENWAPLCTDCRVLCTLESAIRLCLNFRRPGRVHDLGEGVGRAMETPKLVAVGLSSKSEASVPRRPREVVTPPSPRRKLSTGGVWEVVRGPVRPKLSGDYFAGEGRTTRGPGQPPTAGPVRDSAGARLPGAAHPLPRARPVWRQKVPMTPPPGGWSFLPRTRASCLSFGERFNGSQFVWQKVFHTAGGGTPNPPSPPSRVTTRWGGRNPCQARPWRRVLHGGPGVGGGPPAPGRRRHEPRRRHRPLPPRLPTRGGGR